MLTRIACLLPLLAWNGITFAQEADSTLEEVIVTAALLNAGTAPVSATILTEQIQSRRGAAHLEDVITLAPNVTASSGASPATRAWDDRAPRSPDGGVGGVARRLFDGAAYAADPVAPPVPRAGFGPAAPVPVPEAARPFEHDDDGFEVVAASAKRGASKAKARAKRASVSLGARRF